MFCRFVFLTKLLIKKLMKIKEFRLLFEDLLFWVEKHDFKEEDFDYSDSLENYYLYNYYVEIINYWVYKLSQIDFYWFLPKNVAFAWYRTTFTWIRNIAEFRTMRFLKNFCLSFFDNIIWCYDSSFFFPQILFENY